MSMYQPCPAFLFVGNELLRCDNTVTGEGDIIDEMTGQRSSPYRHYLGSSEHTRAYRGIFTDEYGTPVTVTLRWTQSLSGLEVAIRELSHEG